MKWGWEEQALESVLIHSHDSGVGDFLTNSHSITRAERGKVRGEKEDRQTYSLESTDPVPQEVRFSLYRVDKRQLNKDLLLDSGISRSKPLIVIKHCPHEEIQRPRVNSNLQVYLDQQN